MTDANSSASALAEVVETIENFLADGMLDEAEDAIDEAIERFGQPLELRLLQAEFALESEDYVEAVSLARHALDDAEDAAVRGRLLNIMGYALFHDDAVDTARRTFNDAVRHTPEQYDALVGRATVHEHMGFFQAAMLDVERALTLDSERSEGHSIRGSIMLRTGNLQEAETSFAAALEADPSDEDARLQLARLQAVAQRTGEAIETLELLVDEGEHEACVVPGALLRSQLSLTLGSTEAAMEDARKAIELAPESPWGYLQLAACYLTSMNPGQAIDALKSAEDCLEDPMDAPDILALRAAAYDQLEKFDRARKIRETIEGSARLPGFVYGEHLNPAHNIPINPTRPVDVRALMGELFGDPRKAPEGYEKAIRDVVDRLPEIVAQNPGVGRIQIELPNAPGMVSQGRSLIIQVNQAPPAAPVPAAERPN